MEYNFSEYIAALGMPIISLPIAGIEDFLLSFVIDTGSTNNIVSKFVYEQLGQCFTETGNTMRTMGIEGNYIEHKIVTGTLFDGDTPLKATFSVLDADATVLQIQQESGFQIHGWLGIPFLMESHCILDFAQQKLVIGE